MDQKAIALWAKSELFSAVTLPSSSWDSFNSQSSYSLIMAQFQKKRENKFLTVWNVWRGFVLFKTNFRDETKWTVFGCARLELSLKMQV